MTMKRPRRLIIASTVLGALGSHPTLLAGTARGLFRYAPSG